MSRPPHAGPETVSHYRVLERLGAGAMGVVYRADDLRLDRPWRSSSSRRRRAATGEARERLTQEAKAASALDHPNICTIHEIDATPKASCSSRWRTTRRDAEERIARGPLDVPKPSTSRCRSRAASRTPIRRASSIERSSRPM